MNCVFLSAVLSHPTTEGWTPQLPLHSDAASGEKRKTKLSTTGMSMSNYLPFLSLRVYNGNKYFLYFYSSVAFFLFAARLLWQPKKQKINLFQQEKWHRFL